MRQDKLSEGMRAGDLAELVLPLISVDEYQSKIDEDECLVFGFYVHDKDAAGDLNRFLQKSATPLMDTEVSPAPDQHGYFMVFVEVMKNDRLPEIVTSILAELKGLVDISDWQMRVRKIDGLVPFSEDNLKDCLQKIKKSEKHSDVLEFLQPSCLANALFENDLLIMEAVGNRHVHEIVAFDRLVEIMQREHLDESPITFNMRTIAHMNRIRRSLGENWEVSSVGRFILVQHSSDPRALLLRL